MNKCWLLALAILLIGAEGLFAAERVKPAKKNVTPLPEKVSDSLPPISSPYEISGQDTAFNAIDRFVLSGLQKENIRPADVCSDAVFVRRIYLDVTGDLPEIEEVRRFLDNPRQDKRVELINRLLAQSAYADYRTLKWCDLLRVKAEFPINLWPNTVQAYHRWIYDAMKTNMPYDQFVRELLTSSGSNFRFRRSISTGRFRGEPAAIASAVALTFLGERMEKWPADRREGWRRFFRGSATRKPPSGKRRLCTLNLHKTSRSWRCSRMARR